MATCGEENRHSRSAFSCQSHCPATESTEFRPPSPQCRTKRQSLWRAVSRNWHSRCLVLTVSLLGFLTSNVWCRASTFNHVLVELNIGSLFESDDLPVCSSGILILAGVGTVMLYLLYLLECYHSTTRLVLNLHTDVPTVQQYVRQMRRASPILWWCATCFRQMQTLRSNSNHQNPAQFPVTELSSERVLTHICSNHFRFQDCGVRDISAELPDLSREFCFAIRINFSKGFAFANARAAQEFAEARHEFYSNVERFNQQQYVEFREGLDLVGVDFRSTLMTVPNTSHTQPWYASSMAFWTLSALLLSWPLRILLEYNTTELDYHVIKLFGENYNCDVTTPSGTVNNCLIAPSYSETMLFADDNPSLQNGRHHTHHGQQSCNRAPPPSYGSVMGKDCLLDSALHCCVDHVELFTSTGCTNGIRRSFTERDFLRVILPKKCHPRPWTSVSDLDSIVDV